MKRPIPDKQILRREYDRCLEGRTSLLRDLETLFSQIVRVRPSPPGIKGRIKEFSSFYKKYLKLLNASPGGEIPEITDIIGIRVICPFLEDLPAVEKLIKKNLEVIQVERKGQEHTFKEFGYESIHLLFKIPLEMRQKHPPAGCEVAEAQIRTILQDAWAEVEHELVYKAEFTPFDEPMKRKLAAVNANLSLADIIFQEIRVYQRQLNGELEKRRDSFFKKIEETADAFLFREEKPPEEGIAGTPLPAPAPAAFSGGAEASIDDLLLSALFAHNRGLFDEAADFYSSILNLKPAPEIRAMIYKHRGMARFACSRYGEAIDDFEKALENDPASYKAAYYKGVVNAALGNYGEAIEAFDLSLKINSYQPYCLYRRGQAWYHLEDYPQALSDCEAALSLEPFESARKLRDLTLKKLKM